MNLLSAVTIALRRHAIGGDHHSITDQLAVGALCAGLGKAFHADLHTMCWDDKGFSSRGQASFAKQTSH
jgi:hypothetical protein